MKSVNQYGRAYVDWVLLLGRVRAAIFGLAVLAISAILIQMFLTLIFTGQIYLDDILRSIAFGLVSAPFVIYFFNLLVEKLERSRLRVQQSLEELSALREKDIRLNIDLEQKADFLRSFFDASPDLIFYRDDSGRFLGSNRAMELLTGKTEAELLNQTPYDVYPADSAKLIMDTDRDTFVSNTGVTYEQWLRYPNGKLACFEIRKVPYFDRVQNRHCILGFGRDVTERKRYQEVIEKNSRDKSTLMATISHELRTPLNGIIGLSRILLDEPLSAQQREYLKTINISAVSLGHIFSDIIDLEKIDSRRIELFRQSVEFSQILSDISNMALLMANQKKIHFRIEYQHLPDFISIDNARLSQILWNLLSNAVKFTPPNGEILLKVEQKDADHFNFILQDSGIGIPKKEQRKIFAMFYQVSDQEGKKAVGSGIGLAISKRIAKLMGGDLTVESEFGKGATFTLTVQAEVISAQQPVEIQHHSLKVLLVEDIEVNVVVARAMLEKFGCEVEVAMTGEEAFRKFAEQSYDLLLLDIQLPDMTGFEIAQRLREAYEQGKIDYLPMLIALTANIMQTKQEYQQQGMDDVLRKPLSLEALAHCLNQHFGEIFETQAKVNLSNSVPYQAHLPFDCKHLLELIELMGREAVLANLALFKRLMPDYLNALEVHYKRWLEGEDLQRKAVAETAHKIKGALASVGLHQLQQIAQFAQEDNGEAWQQGIAVWISQLQQQWQTDLTLAEQWIQQQK